MAEASSSVVEAVARALLDAAKDALGLVGALLADLVGRTPVSETNVCALCLFFGGLLPPTMTHVLFYPFFRLVFGTLYPAYASYKAVRTKNIKEYVKWMMYWIVFALFTCAETFTDVFLSFWFPFYYEIKIILVLWLLSPATKGSSILYRKFVHPMLSRREHEIDEYIAKAKEQGYSTVLHLGTKGVNYATSVIMQTAIKNLNLPTSISSHSLLPNSSGRVRTTSAPSDEPDLNNQEDKNMKSRRRSRSLAESRLGPKKQNKEEVDVPSDTEDLSDLTSSEVAMELVAEMAAPAKGTRARRTRKVKASSNVQNVDISDNEI